MPIKPQAKIERSSTPRSGYANLIEPVIEILAWCPDMYAKLPPEQVHFLIHFPASWGDEIPPLALRFKSPDTFGFFIEENIKYRREVWAASQRVVGDKLSFDAESVDILLSQVLDMIETSNGKGSDGFILLGDILKSLELLRKVFPESGKAESEP